MRENACSVGNRPCDFMLRKRFVRALIGKIYQKFEQLHAMARYVNAILHAKDRALTICFKRSIPTCERYARYKCKNLCARVMNKQIVRKGKNALARIGKLIYSVHSVQIIKNIFKTKRYLKSYSVQVNVQ